MALRIISDLADASILGTETSSRPNVQKKVLGITLGWAALNAVALLADRRQLR